MFFPLPSYEQKQSNSNGEYTETFLYDLEHDPYELHNLINSKAHESVCEVLAEKLKKMMAEAGKNIPVIHSSEKKDMGQRKLFDGEEDL